MFYACVLLIGLCPHAAPAATTPYVPDSDDVVLERLPAADAMRELRPLRRAVRLNPGNLRATVKLARAYIELARSQSDPRYLGYAENLLSDWPESAPARIQVLRATITQARHEFDKALTQLDRALTADPDNVQAWLTRAHILLAQGRPVPAREACENLSGRIPRLAAVTCISTAAARNGALQTAHERLREAYRQSPRAPAHIRSWALTELGEQAQRLGDDEAAADYFRAALEDNADDVYLLATYADWLLAQGRDQTVLELLDGREQAEALLLRLAIAGAGSERGERWRQTLTARFAAAARRGDIIHQRERARFALDVADQPQRALELALANWAVQREPADLLLLLRCAAAAGQPSAAQPGQQWIEAHNYQDQRLQPLLARLGGER